MNKDALLQLLLRLPRPLSGWVYDAFRRFIRPDTRLKYFDDAFDQIVERSISGDYLEFGVYRGSSFVTAFKSAKRHGLKDMRFFAFDSFEGLPDGEGQKHSKGDHTCTQDVFEQIITKAGVDPKRVRSIKGFYESTLNDQTKKAHDLTKASVVYIDCNLYVSTKIALEFVEELIVPGSIIMFDDWHVFGRDNAEFGEVKAFEEWRLKNCFDVFFDTDGPEKGFIMTRESPERTGAEISEAA